MKQYIDKAKLVAELEKRRKSNSKNKLNLPAAFEDNYLLSFLDTLEVEEVDLEKELERLDSLLYNLDGVAIKGTTSYLTVEDIKDIAKRFFELGLKEQKGC